MMQNWISRKQRPSQHNLTKTLLIIVLILVLGSLIGIRFSDSKIMNRIFNNDNQISSERISGLIESSYISLGLADLELENKKTNYLNKKTGYKCFASKYPSSYSDLWLVEKLVNECQDIDNLICTSTEIQNSDDIVIHFINKDGPDTLVEFLVQRSRNAKPVVSSISFLLDDFAEYKRDEVLEFIWLEIPFGFSLSPVQVPDDQLSRALKNSQGQCIIQLPDNRKAWEIIIKGHYLAKRIKSDEISEANIYDILRHFPLLEGFYFLKSDLPDPEIIEILINVSESLRLTYLYELYEVNQSDSTLYLRGLKMKKLNDMINCKSYNNSKLRSRILKSINQLHNPHKGTFILGNNNENLAVFKEIIPLFKKLNIVPVKPLRKAINIKEL